MHDTSLAQRIVSAAESRARALGYSSVRTVRVRVGAWVCDDPDHLKHSFREARNGSVTRDAELEVEIVHPNCRCEDCGAVFDPSGFALRCETCGSARVVLDKGRDVEVESVEA